MCLMCWSKERLLSKTIPKLWQSGEGTRVELSMVRGKSLAVWEREVGPIGITSDLSQLSLRKVACIHDLISQRPIDRVEWVEWEVVLVVMYSWMSSA